MKFKSKGIVKPMIVYIREKGQEGILDNKAEGANGYWNEEKVVRV